MARLRDVQRGYVYTMTGRSFVLILILLVLLFAASVAFCVFYTPFCMPVDSVGSCRDMVLCAFPYSLLGASLHYIRKLYFVCFHPEKHGCDKSADEEGNEEAKWGLRATVLYFATRPVLVSCASSFLIVGAALGLFSMMLGEFELTGRGCRMIAVLSFILGASGGGSLDALFDIGPRFLRSLLREDGEREKGRSE